MYGGGLVGGSPFRGTAGRRRPHGVVSPRRAPLDRVAARAASAPSPAAATRSPGRLTARLSALLSSSIASRRSRVGRGGAPSDDKPGAGRAEARRADRRAALSRASVLNAPPDVRVGGGDEGGGDERPRRMAAAARWPMRSALARRCSTPARALAARERSADQLAPCMMPSHLERQWHVYSGFSRGHDRRRHALWRSPSSTFLRSSFSS